ncbi:MAG: hypothetical protein WED08_03195 [Patescibacteria group bacterium]
MLKRILTNGWFWLAAFALTSGAGLYIYLNPGVIDQIKSYLFRPAPPPNLPEDFDIVGILPYEDTEDWDFESSPVIAAIDGVNSGDRTMDITFVRPTGFIKEKFQGQESDSLTLKISCTKKQSSLYLAQIPRGLRDPNSLEAVIEKMDIDLFAEASEGDLISGFCPDRECSELNRDCRIYRIVSE